MKHNPGFLKLVEQARARVTECTVADVQRRIVRGEQFHFIDVREDHEFATDHAKGACHLGKGIIERDIETMIPEKQGDCPALRRRLPFGTGGGRSATDGLYERGIDGWGNQGLERGRLST
ncbi:MAG: hypothetical protein Q7U39_06585 [Nitrospira sp.]|nr:hypothetical protein [Nitrospira sp.]